MKRSAGGFLVLFLPVAVALVSAACFVLNWGRALAAADRADTVADASVLTGLRTRAAALETIQRRWADVAADVGAMGAGGRFRVESSRWSRLESDFDDVRRSLSGHRGRIRASMTVVAEAQGVSRTVLETIDDRAIDLGVEAEALPVEDENGRRGTFAGGWYRRAWTVGSEGHAPDRLARGIAIEPPLLPDPLGVAGGVRWRAVGDGSASLEWAGTPDHPGPPGGFPARLEEGMDAGRLVLSGTPLNRPVLLADPGL